MTPDTWTAEYVNGDEVDLRDVLGLSAEEMEQGTEPADAIPADRHAFYDTCAGHPDGCVNYGVNDPCGNQGGVRFPEGYQGAGPMFAAVPLGTPWLDVATRGAQTFILENPYGLPEGLTDLEADTAYLGYAGNTAFLDRGQAEQVADARGHGTFVRYDGLCGSNDWTDKAQREYDAADAEIAAALEAETC